MFFFCCVTWDWSNIRFGCQIIALNKRERKTNVFSSPPSPAWIFICMWNLKQCKCKHTHTQLEAGKQTKRNRTFLITINTTIIIQFWIYTMNNKIEWRKKNNFWSILQQRRGEQSERRRKKKVLSPLALSFSTNISRNENNLNK
jgi:hypothetical protein